MTGTSCERLLGKSAIAQLKAGSPAMQNVDRHVSYRQANLLMLAGGPVQKAYEALTTGKGDNLTASVLEDAIGGSPLTDAYYAKRADPAIVEKLAKAMAESASTE